MNHRTHLFLSSPRSGDSEWSTGDSTLDSTPTIVVGQFLINSTVSAIMYAISSDFSGIDQSALNAAFSTGFTSPHRGDYRTTMHLRAASLSGASRRTP